MPGKWEVECTDEFIEWYDSLDEDDQEQVRVCVDALEQNGPGQGRPLVGQITTSDYPNMKELITGTYRVLFAFDPRQVAIVLIGGDKKGLWNKWYDVYVDIADELYAKHLEGLREEGLL